MSNRKTKADKSVKHRPQRMTDREDFSAPAPRAGGVNPASKKASHRPKNTPDSSAVGAKANRDPDIAELYSSKCEAMRNSDSLRFRAPATIFLDQDAVRLDNSPKVVYMFYVGGKENANPQLDKILNGQDGVSHYSFGFKISEDWQLTPWFKSNKSTKRKQFDSTYRMVVTLLKESGLMDSDSQLPENSEYDGNEYFKVRYCVNDTPSKFSQLSSIVAAGRNMHAAVMDEITAEHPGLGDGQAEENEKKKPSRKRSSNGQPKASSPTEKNPPDHDDLQRVVDRLGDAVECVLKAEEYLHPVVDFGRQAARFKAFVEIEAKYPGIGDNSLAIYQQVLEELALNYTKLG